MAEEMRDIHRRGGTVRRFMVWALLSAPVALAGTLALSLAGHADVARGASTKLEPLPGRLGAVPPGATLVGPAPASTELPLVVTLQPRDPAALAAEAQAVSDPSSPEYHRFLTPNQFSQRYGATRDTVAQVSQELEAQGLTVGAPSKTGLSLPVSGTVAQVQSAFSTPIDKYRLSSGKTGYRNRSAPQVSAAVAPQIEGVVGLDTLSPPQPTTSPAAAAPAGPEGDATSSTAAPALAQGQPSPVSGSCTANVNSVKSTFGALDAVDLSQAYSFDPLYASGAYGSGTTVALVELSGAGYSSSDINTFATCFGITLGNNQVSQVSIDGGGATGPATAESELDIETVLSLAPQANIEVYEGGASDGIYNVLSRIVSDDTAKIVSASWTNGCEAYVSQSLQNSENTLLQTAAVDGQSVFVATGDQGAEGCNVNGVMSAPTGSNPVAQVVDASTGTAYVANKGSNTVSVNSEGTTSNPSNFVTSSSVTTGTAPDAIALDSSDRKVFVANATSSSLTAFSTSTCNQTTTSGCASPTQIASGGHLSAPAALAAVGSTSTLYVGNGNGTVAVYNASTNAFVKSVSLPSSSVPTALAVDTANNFVYVADGTNNRIEYFNAATCNATATSGCSATPATVSVGHNPISLAVDAAAGSLYVGNAGSGGGVSVLSLSTHAVTSTISTGPSVQGLDGSALVRSVGLSPDGNEVLAVLDGLTFPGDVLATINPNTQSITATASLETGTHTMGGLASDSARDLVWVTDQTSNGDVVQNLNLAVSDPASQPYVTAVGGTTVTALGPAPTETTWNDQLHFAEGAGGGGISKTFSMPAYQQSLGTVSGSTGTPCSNASGDCREIPDVSADADPSTGYVIYDSVNYSGNNPSGWAALGGTSGAAPLWAAVLAVSASADGNTAGYGSLNPILYELAQDAPGTYLNDVTSGNNDYNATNSGQFSATSGYDMATGLGTPVTSALATGLTAIPVDVAVSGTQVYGGTPTFTATATFGGTKGGTPFGVSVTTTGVTCTEVGTSTPISSSLPVGSDTLLTSSCSGATVSGVNQNDYTIVYTSAAGDFTVTPIPVNVAVTGSQTYGGSAIFSGTASNPPAGITVTTTGVTCTELAPFTAISPALPVGTRTLLSQSCSGATLSGTNAANYAPAYTSAAGDFTVAPASLTVTASNGSMTYGAAPPAITAQYSGFVNNDTPSSLTTPPSCSTTATSASTVAGSPYSSSCTGAVDPNYNFTYAPGLVTVGPAALTVTGSNGSMTYGGTPPVITPQYSGFVNNDTASSLTTTPTCSTTATSSSPVVGSPYPSTCTGASAPNYTITYPTGSVTVNGAPLSITASGGFMTYGGTPPSIIPSYSGFVNGDSPSSLTTAPTCSTLATGSSAASPPTYASSCAGASDPNYAITYPTGSVTVNKAPLTVTASDGTMTYGGTPPAITAQYSGFVNSDSSSSLSTKPSCSTTATSSSQVATSPYSSSCTGAVDSNYSFTYAPGSVAVTTAPLTVTASSPSMTYGSTPPLIAPLYGGLVNHDTASSLTTQATCSTAATSTSTPSPPTYANACSGASGPNYTITYAPGATTVTRAPINVTVGGSQAWGGSPGFTATAPDPGSLPPGVTGVDTSGITCGQVAPSTAISPTLGGGTYTLVPTSCGGVTLSGSAVNNYTVTFTSTSGDFIVSGGPPPPPPPPPHGYWLVGSDGGIFTFGSAHFYGSTGSITLQRPVVGITPTASQSGYWLVASDGGIFAFGDAGFHGSIPGLGLAPAGSRLPHALNAPIVGMVPSTDGGGYFMVASDGGVFAFGDAQFEGSCPGIGGCNGSAVAVVPDASGHGYWLVTQTGNVYTFGDAPYYGAPGPQGSPITAAVRSADGGGYFILLANGTVYGYGDAAARGGPTGSVGGFNPASAIFTDAGGGGYWVASATGAVYTYGDAPYDGSMAGSHLNGAVIAGTGF